MVTYTYLRYALQLRSINWVPGYFSVLSLVEGIDCGHLLGRKFEIVNIRVGDYSVRVGRLRQWHESASHIEVLRPLRIIHVRTLAGETIEREPEEPLSLPITKETKLFVC